MGVHQSRIGGDAATFFPSGAGAARTPAVAAAAVAVLVAHDCFDDAPGLLLPLLLLAVSFASCHPPPSFLGKSLLLPSTSRERAARRGVKPLPFLLLVLLLLRPLPLLPRRRDPFVEEGKVARSGLQSESFGKKLAATLRSPSLPPLPFPRLPSPPPAVALGRWGDSGAAPGAAGSNKPAEFGLFSTTLLNGLRGGTGAAAPSAATAAAPAPAAAGAVEGACGDTPYLDSTADNSWLSLPLYL